MLSRPWFVFAILFAARTTIAYQFQSIASVGPFLVDEVGIGFGTLGSLIGCYMLPGIVLALPGGLLDQRFGARRMLLVGLLVMAAGGLLTMASSSAAIMFAGRIVSGSGAAILNVILARTVASWFAKEDLAFVMGTFVASWPLGVALSLVSLPSLAMSFGWQAALFVASVPCLACAATIAFAYRDMPSAQPAIGHLRFNLTRGETLLAAIAGAIWGLYNAGYIVFVATMPEFFVQRGLSLLEASNLASIFGWMLLVSLPLGGYLSRRFDRANLLIGSCFLWIAGSAVALALSPATMVSFALLVTVVGLPAGAILAIPTKLLHVDKLASGMGVFFTVFYVALAVLPGAAGIARGAWDSAASPLVFGAVAMGIAFVLLLVLMRLHEVREAVAR